MTGSGTVLVDEMRAYSEVVQIVETRPEFEQSQQLSLLGLEISSARSGSEQLFHSIRHTAGWTIHASRTLRRIVLITDVASGHRRMHQLALHRVLSKRDQLYFSSGHLTARTRAMQCVVLYETSKSCVTAM